MKAISVRQPWASAMVHAGKRVENRSWPTYYRGPVLIHASAGMTKKEYKEFAAFWHCFPRRPLQSYPLLPEFGALQRGGIVARTEIIGCVRDSADLDAAQRPWFFGPYGFVLGPVTPMPFVPSKGALGFFDVDDERLRVPC